MSGSGDQQRQSHRNQRKTRKPQKRHLTLLKPRYCTAGASCHDGLQRYAHISTWFFFVFAQPAW